MGVRVGGWSPAGMHVLAHALWQQRCLEVTSRRHHVEVVDETRRTYRHHGRQRDAPRRIATFRQATLRVAPYRYATLEPLGKPGGSRAFSADGPPQAPAAPRRSCEAKYMRPELWRTFQSTRTRRRREQYIPLVAFCLLHFLADFIICMCEFDFRQAHVFVQLARCGKN